MKASRLPDRKEWERIVDEAFSSNDEHSFSPRYTSRKNAMMRGITMKRRTVDNKRRNSSRALVLSVAAVAAAFVLVPAGVFFAGHSGGTSSPAANMDELAETTAPEEAATEVTEEATETVAEYTITLEDVACYGFKKLQLNYVPEGLVYNEDGAYGGKYHDYDTGGGMSKLLFVADEYQQLTFDNFSYDSAEYDLDGKHVIIRYGETNETIEPENSFSRWIFVQFKDSPYVATLHITDNYSDEEALKVCEGMELVDCEAADFRVNIWRDDLSENPVIMSGESYSGDIKTDGSDSDGSETSDPDPKEAADSLVNDYIDFCNKVWGSTLDVDTSETIVMSETDSEGHLFRNEYYLVTDEEYTSLASLKEHCYEIFDKDSELAALKGVAVEDADWTNYKGSNFVEKDGRLYVFKELHDHMCIYSDVREAPTDTELDENGVIRTSRTCKFSDEYDVELSFTIAKTDDGWRITDITTNRVE